MSIGQINQKKKWKNRRMIVNIGHRRTKINHTYAHTKNSLELLALLLPMMMLLVYLSAILICMCAKKRLQ
jgi:hypothetical protein